MLSARLGLAVTLLGIAFLLPAEIRAERLPIKAYTTADGLAHNGINRIVRDSRGFLWFATNDGLSRFDGYGFTNYGVEHGLPHGRVMDLLETTSGELWVATFGGLVRFQPQGAPAERVVYDNDTGGSTPMFATILPQDPDPRALAVLVLFESRDGTIWCGTRNGLFRLEFNEGQFDLRPVDLGLANEYAEQKYVKDLVEDEHGSLWAATASGLYRRWRDGSTARYDSSVFVLGNELYHNRDHYHFHDLLKDRHGRIWVGSRAGGFFRITADAGRAGPKIVERYGYPRPYASWVYQLLETSDGRLWAGLSAGLLELLPEADADGSRFRVYNRSHGLSHQNVTAVAEDGGGNLWIGTSSGAMRIARHGFVTFGRQDGLAGGNDVFEDSTGDLYVHAATFVRGLPGLSRGDEYVTNHFGRFDGRRFEWFTPGPPFGWGWVAEGSAMRTRRNEWWLATATGLFRYPPLRNFRSIKTTRPIRIFTKRDGLPEVQVYRIFEDSRDDVWFSIISQTNGLFFWNRATDTLRNMAVMEGFPNIADELPRAFAEDRAGNIWIGLNTGITRYCTGKFTFFTQADGLPPGPFADIHVDTAGRMWLASSRGLVRIDDPGADRPIFTVYTTADGLSGNSIEVITEDVYGRIYVGTGRGIDQFDPMTSRIRHFTTGDGLAPGWMPAAFRDRTGALWFGTHTGLSRFIPPPPESSAPPRILITGVAVAGQPYPVSAIGEAAVNLADLRPDGNNLQIDFASLRFAPGERLRYHYRLEGAAGDWSPLTTRRSVSFASLSPGRYRFLVRAVNADGVPSTTPAVVAFTVLPQFWLRWWFLSLAALAVGAAALALHRYRVARVLEIERVRTRIATDLHDDIGANLTRIAILSEVARQQSRAQHDEVDEPLASIAGIARESAASMSDIVWAISPERDTLQDVVRKMREYAEEVFEARDIALALDLPDAGQPIRIGVDLRRDLYLVFKEAVNNSMRHSRCTRVSIALRPVRTGLILEVADDGIGFDAGRETDGNGLVSMRRRAERLGGTLAIETAAGGGTTVRLTMPLGTGARAGGHRAYTKV